MDTRQIRSESPKEDQWKLLSRFSYPTNIRRFLDDNGSTATYDGPVDFIAGCVQQGESYFSVAEASPIDIAPLLVYYGAANLLAGVAAMLMASRPTIKSHGMHLKCPGADSDRIADAIVVPVNPEHGALQQFCNVFSKGCMITNGGQWSLEEILGSIPDLKRDFENSYEGAKTHTVPVEIVQTGDRFVERVSVDELTGYSDSRDAVLGIANLTDAYLSPQYMESYVILHRRRRSPEIGSYSIFGGKYLQIGHTKNRRLISPNQVILMFMGLFALGYLSRYHPEIWNPFVRNDQTGEKLVIERFLEISKRYLPNLVLNEIHGENIQFVHEAVGVSRQ